MQRIFRKRKFIVLAVVIVLIVLSSVGYSAVRKQYRSIDVTFNELLSNVAGVKEFDVKNGKLLSLSDDPWIEYPVESGTEIKTITIDVSYLSENYTSSEVFVMHNDQSFTRYPETFTLGENVIRIKDKNISSVRFDLLTGSRQEIGINRIIFNDEKASIELFNDKIKDICGYLYLIPVFICYLVIPGILISALLYFAVNIEKFKNKRKKTVIWACVSIGTVVFVYMISLLFSTKVLYKERRMDFSELVKGASDFAIDENNKMLTSTGYDSWIYVPYDTGNNVRTITINLNSWDQSEDDANSELYIFYEIGNEGFDLLNCHLEEGENTIYIPEYLKKISAFRFDFTYSSGVSIGLDNIEFNRADVLKSAVIDEISGYISKIFIWLGLILTSAAAMLLGGKTEIKSDSGINAVALKSGKFVIAFLLLLTFVFCLKAAAAAIVPMAFIGFYSCRYGCIEKYDEKHKKILYIILILSALLTYLFIPEVGISHLLYSTKGGQCINLFISMLCTYVFINTAAILYKGGRKNKCNYKISIEKVASILIEVLIVFVMTASLEVLAKVFFEEVPLKSAILGFIESKTIWVNVMLWGVIYFSVRNLLGKVLGNIFAFIVYLFFFIGNFVKLKYHDTIFLPMDILQIEDFFGIVFRYIPEFLFLCVVLFIIGVILFFIYKKRKYIVKYGPNLYISALSVFMILTLSNMIDKNAFIDMGFDVTQTWLVAKDCIKKEGLITYSYTKYRELLRIFPKPGENYSEEYMTGLKNEFDSIGGGLVSDVKPNVILIMEESMFDVATVPDVDFSLEVDKNIRKYEKAKTISPKYGGGTASVEFEALTGMSNFFFLDNIVPYVTYWNDENTYIPGLAGEFSKNGYSTTAIHPNDGGYYNRNIIYSAMGFDKFIQKEDLDFNDENVADDGWFKDEPLADVIKEEMEKTDEPQFIFTITVENHMLYESKYDETEVKLSSDKLNDNELHQLEQYSQGVYDADKFVEKMINIVDNADRPTIMYIWGDHLPALTAFNTLGFIDNKYNKYSTPLIAYSNYKDIEIGQEYITPNQIAPQILRDAEIDYSSYFDFIYSLREKYPVIQKEFGIDQNDEMIKKYEEVQYDLLFGEQYLIEGE